jgi:hypothetical protein
MATYYTRVVNDAVAKRYCEPHGIDPEDIYSIEVNIDGYFIRYGDKDGHERTLRVYL